MPSPCHCLLIRSSATARIANVNDSPGMEWNTKKGLCFEWGFDEKKYFFFQFKSTYVADFFITFKNQDWVGALFSWEYLHILLMLGNLSAALAF